MKVKTANILAAIALLVTGFATTGCIMCFSDEPKATASMMD